VLGRCDEPNPSPNCAESSANGELTLNCPKLTSVLFECIPMSCSRPRPLSGANCSDGWMSSWLAVERSEELPDPMGEADLCKPTSECDREPIPRLARFVLRPRFLT
jgi:hypothetical protein